jgi:hypothetical protein
MLLAVAVVVCAVAASADASLAGRWVTIRTPGIRVDYGNNPAKQKQYVVGRLRLDRVVRVTSTTVRGRRVTGDLLVVKGSYQNLATTPSNWHEGIAFYLGLAPQPCGPDTCGPGMPTGDWYTFTPYMHSLADVPKLTNVASRQTVAFRLVVQLNPGAAGPNPAVTTLGDLWLLPIYDIHFPKLPFLRGQLISLATYFGTTTIPAG